MITLYCHIPYMPYFLKCHSKYSLPTRNLSKCIVIADEFPVSNIRHITNNLPERAFQYFVTRDGLLLRRSRCSLLVVCLGRQRHPYMCQYLWKGTTWFWVLHMIWMRSSSLQCPLLCFGSWFSFWDILAQSVELRSVLSRKRLLNIYYRLNHNIPYSSVLRNTQLV